MILNTSIICLSLKYINKRYELICNISKWIYFELTKLNYKESKFVKSLDKKDFETIEILIKFNKNTDSLSEHLIRYCKACCDIIKLAIENNTYKDNKNPINFNFSDIIKLFIDNGADVRTNDNFLLTFASSFGFLDIVILLIDNGADIHTQGNCALKYASAFGFFDIVKLLIENGANVHAEDDCALKYAIKYGHSDIVKLFIENGANKDLVN